jgi:HD-GYP domain-containing protein (c-di-GMP phosphodiesterase class II)
MVARRLELTPREVRGVRCAARVHDVGKIIVSPEILEKPGRLARCEPEAGFTLDPEVVAAFVF